MLLAPDASPYAIAHETAHGEQQTAETWAWRAHRRGMMIPWLCSWTRLWLEIQAARMALEGMKRLGTWTHAAQQEASRGLRSYWKKVFVS